MSFSSLYDRSIMDHECHIDASSTHIVIRTSI